MKNRTVIFSLLGVAVVIAALLSLARAYDRRADFQAPEFTHREPQDWINSAPLALRGLRGQVVLLDFWTFECWNCYRSFPWLKSVEQKFSDRELTVIGVHTPEFERERVRANVERKVKEFALAHPVMIDNDYSYWRAMGNHYWPAFYLIDKRGQVRAIYVGETHVGDARAKNIEQRITELLAERAPDG